MDKVSRKRSSTSDVKIHKRIECIISEFEDVLVPSSFIKLKVHGYVNEHAEKYMNENFEKTEIKKFIEGLKKEKVEGFKPIPEEGKKEEIVKSVVEHVKALLGKNDTCSKVDPLVTPMLKSALDKNELQIQLYDDTAKCLKAWVANGYDLMVLTNRSRSLVHTILLRGCEGLNQDKIGVVSMGDNPMSVKESYAALADKCTFVTHDILFLTHCPNEAVAASAAGMESTLVCRRADNMKDIKEDKKSEKDSKNAEVLKEDKALESVPSFNTVSCLGDVLKTEGVPCKQTRTSGDPPPTAAAATAE